MSGTLLLLPSLRARSLSKGRVGVTAKFLSGVEAFADGWDGPVHVVMEAREGASENLDDVVIQPASRRWSVEVLSYEDAALRESLCRASVVLGALGHRQNGVASLARACGVPFATTTEYTLTTRLQIASAEEPNPLVRVRRQLWERAQERRNRRTVAEAAGLQCNGTPTFDAYAPLHARTLLFFDTRTRDCDVLSTDRLRDRSRRVIDGEPLRLAFSGRLDPMKGAVQLPHLAKRLREWSVPFTMDICGDGSDAHRIERAIAQLGLGEHVRMRGVLEFHQELIPFMREEVDVFVCPHLQGDPSCTYLETMACGVPIVGYANEAWAGIADRVAAGWTAPLGDLDKLAERIRTAHVQRATIVERAHQALTFARAHTYERTFAARVRHLQSLRAPIGRGDPGAAPERGPINGPRAASVDGPR